MIDLVRLLLDDRFSDVIVDDILDKVQNLRTFGQRTYNIAIGG